ncbi:MAG: YkgJ family cysteine cluster protein [Lachnospira sp.]
MKLWGCSMLRNVRLEDISDGKLYKENDMVRTDTCNCSGCKKVCCIGMGKTIILDPYDVCLLTCGLNTTFEELLNESLELNVVDGCILPNLKMREGDNACYFLREDNLCNIHDLRPGICRMFPLGRYWEDETNFSYIFQTGECNKEELAKIKVKKWIGIDDISTYNECVVMWHSYMAAIRESMENLNDEQKKILNMYNIRTFYQTPYSTIGNFRMEFSDRIIKAREMFGI